MPPRPALLRMMLRASLSEGVGIVERVQGLSYTQGDPEKGQSQGQRSEEEEEEQVKEEEEEEQSNMN